MLLRFATFSPVAGAGAMHTPRQLLPWTGCRHKLVSRIHQIRLWPYYSKYSAPSSLSQQSLLHTGHALAASNDQETPPVLPPLMDFPRFMWPRFFLSLQNLVYTYIISTYMDPEFDIKEFDLGARQALSIVSKKLASGNIDELDGLVDPETIAEIRPRLSTFSVFQRGLLSVEIEDIFFSFPHRIGVILPDADPPPQVARSHVNNEDSSENRPPQTRQVEITVVFHIFRGFVEKTKETEDFSLRRFINSEDRNNVMVCNYRFFRDFTKGVENPTWIINKLNHFLPVENREY